jgi:hypothetical protein
MNDDGIATRMLYGLSCWSIIGIFRSYSVTKRSAVYRLRLISSELHIVAALMTQIFWSDV